MQRLESISLGSYSFFNVETIRLQSCVDHFHSFLDNPVLRQIQLGESTLMGNPDDDRKMHTDPPYNYLNAIFLESTLYHPHFAIKPFPSIDRPSLTTIQSSACRNFSNFGKITIHQIAPLQNVQLGLYSFININEMDIVDSDGWEDFIKGFLSTSFLEEDRKREEEEERERNQHLLEEEENNEDSMGEEEEFGDDMGIDMSNIDETNIDPEILQMLLEMLRNQRQNGHEGDEDEDEDEVIREE